jgi:hypothetical protein
VACISPSSHTLYFELILMLLGHEIILILLGVASFLAHKFVH